MAIRTPVAAPPVSQPEPPAEQRRQAGLAATGPNRGRPVMLVADDEAPVRRLLERLGAKVGYEVLTCETGSEAIQVAADRRPDVALVDLRMPGADGLSVLRAIRSSVPEAAVIIMTGYAAIDSAVEAIKLGALEYWPKPIDLKALRSTLTELYDRVESRTARQADDAITESGVGASERPRHLLLVRRTDRPSSEKAARPAPLLRVVETPRPPSAGPGSEARSGGSGRARRRGARSGSSRGPSGS